MSQSALVRHTFVLITSVIFGLTFFTWSVLPAEAATPGQGESGKARPLPAKGTAYYVDSRNGNDSNDGLTPQTAWKSLHKVNATGESFKTGTDVYLKSDSVFENQQLSINWSGNSADRAIIGSYHQSGSNYYAGLLGSQRPEINGTFEDACEQAKNCKMGDDGKPEQSAVPNTQYGAMINSWGKNYLTIENLFITDSAGQGINTGGGGSIGVIIQNNIFDHMAQSPALFAQNTKDGVLRDNVSTRGNYCDKDRYAICETWAGWGAGFLVHDSPDANVLFENNSIDRHFGEGFNCLRSSKVIMRGNYAGNLVSNAYYVDECSDTLLENNIAWSDPTKEYGGQAAINIGVEHYGKDVSSLDNVIRNNLLASGSNCLSFGVWPDSAKQGAKVGFEFYNNTCMSADSEAVRGWDPVSSFDEIIIRNNIFYTTETKEGICNLPRTSKITLSNNLWSSKPTDPDCQGIGDVYGDPKVRGGASSNFRAMSWDRIPKPSDFELLANSPALNAGVPIGIVTTDFYGNKRDNTPNLGAIEDGANASSPSIPTVSPTSSPTPTLTNPCHLLNKDSVVNSLYATPYDHTTGKINITVNCPSNTNAEVAVGWQGSNLLIGEVLYYRKLGDTDLPNKIPLLGIKKDSYLDGVATALITTEPGTTYEVRADICRLDGAGYKCNCKNTSCSERGSLTMQTFKAGGGQVVTPPTVAPVTNPSNLPTITLTDPGTKCSDEYQTCSFTGQRTVRYGIGTTFVEKVLTGPIACSNSVFGDPAYGYLKACYLAPADTVSVDSSTPQTGKFKLGDTIVVDLDGNLNVRDYNQGWNTVCQQSDGAKAKILNSTPKLYTDKNNKVWTMWQVDFNCGTSAWVTETYIKLFAGAVVTTPTTSTPTLWTIQGWKLADKDEESPAIPTRTPDITLNNQSSLNYEKTTTKEGFAGLGIDNYAIRAQRQYQLEAGNYTMKVGADDGVRVWINNQSIFNVWKDQSIKEQDVPFTVTTSGLVTIKVEHYENKWYGALTVGDPVRKGAVTQTPVNPVVTNPTPTPVPAPVATTPAPVINGPVNDIDPAQGSKAPVYYVSFTNGNDSNNGTSVKTPWKNLSKVSALSGITSAKVYLLSGDLWPNQSVDIRWSGTASDIAHFGCYKVVNGEGKICSNSDPEPIITGWISEACFKAKNCPYTQWQGGVTSVWDQQVSVEGSYIDIENIFVRDSAVAGFNLGVAGGKYGSITDVRFISLTTLRTGHPPIRLLAGAKRWVIRDSNFSFYNLCRSQARSGGLATDPEWCAAVGGGGWPGGAQAAHIGGDCDCLVENNIIHSGYGEGMNAYNRSNAIVFRGNRVGNTLSVTGYTDASRDTIYESNVMWGTQGDFGYPTNSNFGGGIVVSIEEPVSGSASQDALRNYIRNNVCIDCGWSFQLANQIGKPTSRLFEAYMYNNASIASHADVFSAAYFSSANSAGFEVINNIESLPTGGSSCSTSLSNSVVKYNVFTRTVSDRCVHSTNKKGDATFAVDRTQAQYMTINRSNHQDYKMTDFIPKASSLQVGAGDPSLATRDCIDTRKFTYALSNMSVPFKPNPTLWGKCAAYDMDGDLVPTTSPSAGPQQL